MTDSSSQQSEEAAKARALRPRDAATLIIVDRASGEPRILMGQRRLDQVFMPGKYVFPGGRVDATDRLISSADELRPRELSKLLLDMKGTPSPARARAIGLAAIRETFEEAGLLIASPGAAGSGPHEDIPSWKGFFDCGFQPKLSSLTLFARAITPPGRPRRYDTRFFCVAADEISHTVDTRDGELLGLHWLTMDEARSLDIPSITRVILEDLLDHLKTGPDAENAPVPYYYHKNGTFRRELLNPDQSPA
jgi:8-oxo-dGTP pyrophosphatase MutT (NUDIX family)